MIAIRKEKAEDILPIRDIHEAAFGRPAEAKIVDALRRNVSNYLSLVADDEGRLVGHILFTPAVIEYAGERIVGMGLAPMAVIPDYQRQEIGSNLVTQGLKDLRKRGCPFVIVLGYPEFYSRFGFTPASRRNIRCQWEEVPDEAFLIFVLDQQAMRGVKGVAHFRKEFNQTIS